VLELDLELELELDRELELDLELELDEDFDDPELDELGVELEELGAELDELGGELEELGPEDPSEPLLPWPKSANSGPADSSSGSKPPVPKGIAPGGFTGITHRLEEERISQRLIARRAIRPRAAPAKVRRRPETHGAMMRVVNAAAGTTAGNVRAPRAPKQLP
jgi:hypothetical protein